MMVTIIAKMSFGPDLMHRNMVMGPLLVAFGLTLGVMTVTITRGPMRRLRGAIIGMMATAMSERQGEMSDGYTVVRTPGPPRDPLVALALALMLILLSLMPLVLV